MIKVKRNFLSLSLAFIAVTGSLSAMEGNPEQLTMAQSAIFTCGQMVWNALSGVKNGANYGATYAHDTINSVLTHMISHDEEQSPVILNTNESLKSASVRLFYAFSALQSGMHYGANYAHNVINGALTQVVSREEEL